MTDILLVHGGSGGAWYWERLLPHLTALGHQADAADVPMDDPDNDLERCAALAADAAAGLQRPVVVGHSIAGCFLPLVARNVAARRMVFLCAMVPIPGQSLADQQAGDPDMVRFPYALVRDEQGRTLATPEVARAMYYPDATDADAAWATAQLRPQAPTVRMSPFPVGEWPEVPSTYVVARDDTVVDPEWSRRAARERLGVEPIEIDGAHSPMITRPKELAALLNDVLQTRDGGAVRSP